MAKMVLGIAASRDFADHASRSMDRKAEAEYIALPQRLSIAPTTTLEAIEWWCGAVDSIPTLSRSHLLICPSTSGYQPSLLSRLQHASVHSSSVYDSKNTLLQPGGAQIKPSQLQRANLSDYAFPISLTEYRLWIMHSEVRKRLGTILRETISSPPISVMTTSKRTLHLRNCLQLAIHLDDIEVYDALVLQLNQRYKNASSPEEKHLLLALCLFVW